MPSSATGRWTVTSPGEVFVPSFWTHRYPGDAFSRLDEADDADFYATSRSGDHLDRLARSTLQRIVNTLVIEEHPAILDLMAGSDCHFPESLRPRRVAGVGLDEQELAANPALTDRIVRDLNRQPGLPFEDACFDVVHSALGVAYLTRPFEVFAEAARVLKPGGLLLVTFSDRTFKSKAIKLWLEATGPERKMLVEEYFASTRAFEPVQSFVSRGRPRPPDDKYAGLGIPSDTVWAVYADRRGASPTRPRRPPIAATPRPGPDVDELERRKREVRRTLRCPYCEHELEKFELAQSPFCEWPNEYMYICFNNDCPYLVGGWQVMNEQGNPGFSYRLMYNPDQDRCMPVPVPSVAAARQQVVMPRG